MTFWALLIFQIFSTAMESFFATIGKIGLLLILTSDHTGHGWKGTDSSMKIWAS